MDTTRLKRFGALAGIVFPILQMVSQGMIQVGGMEPAFGAPASEIVTFFTNRSPALFELGGYMSILSLVVLLWFIGALWDNLRQAEGGTGWVSGIALGSGLVAVAVILQGQLGWGLAMFRLENADPLLTQFLFDFGNASFANYWVALGSMMLAAGLIFRNTGSQPPWLALASLAIAVGLILARAVWTQQIAFLPYVLFWVWAIVIGIRMLRQEQPA